MSQAPIFGLVDPIRTAVAFFEELISRKIKFIAIESGLVDPLGNVPCPILQQTHSIEFTASQARQHKVTHIIGCVDPSITYADKLSAQLGVLSNGLRCSEARRNKFLMNRAVAEAGLRTPHQLESNDLTTILNWASLNGFPVVIKPVESGGTDNVHLCENPDAIVEAFQAIYEKKNFMGTINRTVLAQEYIDGIEYFVDCVSYSGQHVPVNCFRYQKGTHNGRAFVYEKEYYLPWEDAISRRLIDFSINALDALEFRVGPSHMELKISSKGEIVFIEVGPRLNGGETYRLVQDARADGKSQVQYSIDAFLSLPAPDPAYKSMAHAVRFFLIIECTGRVIGFPHKERIERLASFKRMSLHVEVGQFVRLTTDFATDAGWVDLVNVDEATLRADERELDRLVKEGLFSIDLSALVAC